MILLALAVALAAPQRVPVETSRGAFDLVVYAPPVPAPSRPLVLVLSGEGGWRSFDDELSRWLAADGWWVGGLDAMKYFWKAQDDRAALVADVRAYVAALEKSSGRPAGARVVLLGFSFGADLAPWIAGAEGWEGRIAGLAMLGPDATGSLEFRVSEMMGFAQTDHVFDVAAALAGTAGIPKLFVHGGKDKESEAPELHERAPAPKRLVVVEGADHHFSGKEDDLRAKLLAGLRAIADDE